jgi:hypothetical protein
MNLSRRHFIKQFSKASFSIHKSVYLQNDFEFCILSVKNISK